MKLNTNLIKHQSSPRKSFSLKPPSILKQRFKNGFLKSSNLLFLTGGQFPLRNTNIKIKNSSLLKNTIAKRAFILTKLWFFTNIASTPFHISLKAPLLIAKKRYKRFRPQLIFLGLKFRLRIKQRRAMNALMQKSLIKTLTHKSVRTLKKKRKRRARKGLWANKKVLKLRQIHYRRAIETVQPFWIRVSEEEGQEFKETRRFLRFKERLHKFWRVIRKNKKDWEIDFPIINPGITFDRRKVVHSRTFREKRSPFVQRSMRIGRTSHIFK